MAADERSGLFERDLRRRAGEGDRDLLFDERLCERRESGERDLERAGDLEEERREDLELQ